MTTSIAPMAPSQRRFLVWFNYRPNVKLKVKVLEFVKHSGPSVLGPTRTKLRNPSPESAGWMEGHTTSPTGGDHPPSCTRKSAVLPGPRRFFSTRQNGTYLIAMTPPAHRTLQARFLSIAASRNASAKPPDTALTIKNPYSVRPTRTHPPALSTHLV